MINKEHKYSWLRSWTGESLVHPQWSTKQATQQLVSRDISIIRICGIDHRVLYSHSIMFSNMPMIWVISYEVLWYIMQRSMMNYNPSTLGRAEGWPMPWKYEKVYIILIWGIFWNNFFDVNIVILYTFYSQISLIFLKIWILDQKYFKVWKMCLWCKIWLTQKHNWLRKSHYS